MAADAPDPELGASRGVVFSLDYSRCRAKIAEDQVRGQGNVMVTKCCTVDLTRDFAQYRV